jgi:CheY-like chemotaxis protein
MGHAADSQTPPFDRHPEPELEVAHGSNHGRNRVSSGIPPLDDRLGGFEPGGVYVVAGTPGPAKLVAAFQFLKAGTEAGERVLLITGGDAPGILDVSRAWGTDLDSAWRSGALEILGFKDDFEMRVLRSTEPEDVFVELDRIATPDVTRIAVDPGSMFLRGGVRTILGRAFLEWARRHPATVCATLPVDTADSLPSSAEWLVHGTTAIMLMDRRSDGLFQVRMNQATPESSADQDPITLQLTPGKGLGAAEGLPVRRRRDRPGGDPDRLLLVSLVEGPGGDLETWAGDAFQSDQVPDALQGVEALQNESTPYGGVLIHASRKRIREAIQACRVLRPMTAAAIVVASDDSLRSTDRVNILDAGADDCLSGGVDFRELATRIRQAAAVGGKPAPMIGVHRGPPAAPVGGAVPWDLFGNEVARRASDSTLSTFSVLSLRSPGASNSDLATLMAERIRDRDGDLVACTTEGCSVLLQGARREAAQAFLDRLGPDLRVAEGPVLDMEVKILSYPADKDAIADVFGRVDSTGNVEKTQSKPGGSGGQEA